MSYKDIFRAAHDGNVEDVKLFIEQKGRDINEINNDDGSVPLHSASYNRNVEVTKFLVSKGAKINAKNKDNFTPLDMALLEIEKPKFKNNAKVAQYLTSINSKSGKTFNKKKNINLITKKIRDSFYATVENIIMLI